jgi:hypothetical protein
MSRPLRIAIALTLTVLAVLAAEFLFHSWIAVIVAAFVATGLFARVLRLDDKR